MRLHIHWYRYIKTGVAFTYTMKELEAMPSDMMAVMAFAGPVRELWRCRCGKKELR